MTTLPRRNLYRNNEVAINIGNAFWSESEANGVAGIVAELRGDTLETPDGHRFKNFCCCSYLDLDSHPKVIQGAIDALRRFGVLDHCIPRSRVQIPALLELEAALSELFGAQVVSAISASVATAGVLPLLASGHLTGKERPVMAFDKTCHVSMATVKPICADETEVVTIRHHDLDALEDLCKSRRCVAYVCDGSDSLGGYAPVDSLLDLQSRYGLYLFFDDCHSISICGDRGEGYVRSLMPELSSRIIIVATLNKAFGTSGGAVMFGGRSSDELRIVERFAGAMSFSQPMNTAAVGASIASAEIHTSSELGTLQRRLAKNIEFFDDRMRTPHFGETYPIRVIPCSEEDVIPTARRVFEAGYYASPVFFPIVKKGSAGLRVMIRAGHSEDDITGLVSVLSGGTSAPAVGGGDYE